jgi:hypothetical protein
MISEVSHYKILRGHSWISQLKDPIVRFKKHTIFLKWIAWFEKGCFEALWARNYQKL